MLKLFCIFFVFLHNFYLQQTIQDCKAQCSAFFDVVSCACSQECDK